jgi:hypothetical protein
MVFHYIYLLKVRMTSALNIWSFTGN